MSSILTNNSAMVALQTLKSINNNLGKVQSEISTGKTVESAKDNASVWAISKVMSSDVKGFEAISDSLALGQSTVGVALNAAEGITDLLTEIKGKIVASQEDNVDRAKIQTDIEALTGQIGSIAGAAQFNGLNMLSNQETTTAYTAAGTAADGSGTVSVLSSLDRSGTGVAASNIDVAKADLTTQAGAKGTLVLAASALTAAGTATASGAANATYTVVGETATTGRTQAVMAGDSYEFNMTVFDAALTGTPFASAETANAGDGRAMYVAKDGDTVEDIATNLANTINFRLAEQGASEDFTVVANGADVVVTNNTTTALAAAAAGDFDLDAGGTTSGGLELLSELDVSTEDGAAAALSAIEGLIQTSIDSAAALGSSGGRIETQADFVSKLTDSLTSGIGALVDADMEAASAKLQALQTQQQLGVQALSIANQGPQTILSLFR